MSLARSSLLVLTTKLIGDVISYVRDKKDILALRLICQGLRVKTYSSFTKVSYHTIERSFSLPSIQRLNHIAKHKELREQVKERYFIAKGDIAREDMCKYGCSTLFSTFGIGYDWREWQQIR